MCRMAHMEAYNKKISQMYHEYGYWNSQVKKFRFTAKISEIFSCFSKLTLDVIFYHDEVPCLKKSLVSKASMMNINQLNK